VLTREQILRAVWGYEYDPGTNVVDVYIGYLRRKLGPRDGTDPSDGRRDTPIVTVRSVGYRFDESE
jgi:DNA-binding response OmpR family regulator